MLNKAEYPFLVQTSEEVLQIRLQYPSDLASRNDFIERG